MQRLIIFIILILSISGCSTPEPEKHPSGIIVTEVNPDKKTALTKQNLLQLAQVYDLSPFLFTKNVRVQSRVQSHSHPILVLDTKNAENPKKLLATFLHEEIHWWLTQNKEKSHLAIKDLKKVYRKVPSSKRIGPQSTYLHLIVCYLELKGLTHYLGKTDARRTITRLMNSDKAYSWIYNQVLYKDQPIKKIVTKYKLSPI